jgi:hypothetical protein
MLVQALSGDAKAFYEKLGFEPSTLDLMMLLITLADLTAAVGQYVGGGLRATTARRLGNAHAVLA